MMSVMLRRHVVAEGPIVPKYYYVSMDCIEAERAKPGSQKRVASSEGTDGNIFLWGQSVYIISQLLGELSTEGVTSSMRNNPSCFSIIMQVIQPLEMSVVIMECAVSVVI